jgi:undecaprenyl-diphosphatase
METGAFGLRSPARALARLDHLVLRAARGRGRGLEPLMVTLGSAAEDGALWLAIGAGAAALDPPRRRRWLVAAAVGPAAIVANLPIKRLVRRPRPRLDLPRLGVAPSEHSFPSAHAVSAFAAASAFKCVTPIAAGPAFGLAVVLSAGRPYLGMHHPSDVIAGALLGLSLGRLFAPVFRSPLLESPAG